MKRSGGRVRESREQEREREIESVRAESVQGSKIFFIALAAVPKSASVRWHTHAQAHPHPHREA